MKFYGNDDESHYRLYAFISLGFRFSAFAPLSVGRDSVVVLFCYILMLFHLTLFEDLKQILQLILANARGMKLEGVSK